MNAHRTVKAETFRITILPDKRLRLYANPQARGAPGILDPAPLLSDCSFMTTVTADGWLMHETLGGLPIRKIPGLRSIEEAWDYEVITIERLENGRYVEIDDLGVI